MAKKILIVDDDPSISEVLALLLQAEGYETLSVGDGLQAISQFRATQPDLILLDLMLPGMDGMDVCRIIRAESQVPIIMLTAKTGMDELVSGFDMGVDDYITKPFKTPELLARIQARLPHRQEDVFEIGDLLVDIPEHTVTRDGEEISLTPTEFSLLTTLASKPREVFSRSRLLSEVWGDDHADDSRLVNVHIQRLRKKIERDPDHPTIVLTVRGVGYKTGADVIAH